MEGRILFDGARTDDRRGGPGSAQKERARVLSSLEFKGLLKDILGLPIRLYGHRDLLPFSSELAHLYRLTIYDSLFLALADIHRSPLLTADEKLGRVAQRMGLALDS